MTETPPDLADTIRRMGIDLRVNHFLAPGTMLLVSPPVTFRSLLMAPPKWETEEPPLGLTNLRVRFSRPEPVFPRYMVMTSFVGGPTSYELRMGPYEDVAEPWCVVKNLDTGRREVHDWPLPAYITDHLVGRRS